MLRALVAALLLAVTPVRPAAAQDLRLFTVGSGETGGAYFAAVGLLCDNLNRQRRGVLRCSPEATPGSIYNLAALRNRQLDFAMVQSDWQRAAFVGTDAFGPQGPMTSLRSVMALFPEAVTVLARPGAGIATLADLPGKRIDIGHPASGRRATATRLISGLGLDTADFAALFELPTGAAVDELCSGRIDATVLIVGHPNATVEGATERCNALVIPVAGPAVDGIFSGSSDFVRATIPAGMYPGVDSDVPTYAVTATLVTRSDMDADIVQALVTDTLAALPALAVRSPLFAGLTPMAMRSRGVTAPLHPGAEAAFGGTAAGG